jgi:predicted phage terminase large subunit-like protein
MASLATRRFRFSKQPKARQAGWETETNEGYEEWLHEHFGHIATSSLAPHHHALYRWFDSLKPGLRPAPRIEIWARGAAKSSTAEIATAFLATRRPLRKRFCLYVSGTQDQADLHVKSIASLLETVKEERAIGRYGHSKGWRRDQLLTEQGFVVAGFGLDTALRGVKIENARPDLFVLDDIDSEADTPKTVAKKIQALTSAVLPTGAPDAAILVIQNLIHEEGIVAQLADGRAEFLLDREVMPVVPAIRGDFRYELQTLENGRKAYRIISGEPTWSGQSIEVCERQMSDWGLRAFLREAQHDVTSASGYFFNQQMFELVETFETSDVIRYCRAWDLAATEGGGDYTCGVLMGRLKNDRIIVLDVIRAQLASDNVRRIVRAAAENDRENFGKVRIHLPQDPGQAGKDQAVQFALLLKGFDLRIEPVSGKKSVRARGWADCVNSGNALLLNSDWIRDFKEEHRKFREDEEHMFDDQVDAAADAYNEIGPRSRQRWDALVS